MKKYKQILIICGLIIVIIVGIIIYFIQNKEMDYTFLEVDDKNTISVNAEQGNETGINGEIKDESNSNGGNSENSGIESKNNDGKNKIVVHITGAVVNQGIVEIKENARIIDAIEAAGGARDDADLSKINLAYVIEDGIKIYVPSVNDKEDEDEYVVKNSGKEIITGNSLGKNESTSEKIMVNINTATAVDFQKLPGVGESIANRIIAYRNENGKFKNIEDLKNVSGIGESKFNNIRAYVYVK